MGSCIPLESAEHWSSERCDDDLPLYRKSDTQQCSADRHNALLDAKTTAKINELSAYIDLYYYRKIPMFRI